MSPAATGVERRDVARMPLSLETRADRLQRCVGTASADDDETAMIAPSEIRGAA
jgi:hypothetical protein